MFVDDFALNEAGLGAGGGFVVIGTVADGAGDAGGVAGAGEAKFVVIACWVDSLKRTGIDADDGGGGHELTEGDVSLADIPVMAGFR